MIESYINNSVFSFFSEKREEHFKQPLKDVEEEIDNILKQVPNNIRALQIKTQILYKYHLQFEQALNLIKQILIIDHNNIDARIDIVQIYILKKEKNAYSVQVLLDECFEIDKYYWRSYYTQCVLYFHLEKIELGENIIKQAKLVIPYNHWLESLYAQIDSDNKKRNNSSNSSMKIVDKILEEQPKDYEMLIRLAYTYINLNKAELTEKLLLKALALNPNSAKGCNNYGYLLRINKEYQKSIDQCQRAIQIDNQYLDAFYNMATSHYNLQEYEKSIQFFKRCIQIDRNRIGSYQELVYLFMEIIKDENEANYYLNKFLKHFPFDEYGNNLYFLQKFRLLCEDKDIDNEEAEITQFRNIDRIQKYGTNYPFITYQNSSLTLNYLYND